MDVATQERVTTTNTDALYERFPHLRQIDTMWGSRECRRYIYRLMTDTRGGTRQGFPKEHAVTIMYLLMEHDERFPQFENEGHDHRWGDDSMRRGAAWRGVSAGLR